MSTDVPQLHSREGEPEGLIESLPAAVYRAVPGATGRWYYVSAQIETMLGYSPSEWMADPGLWARRIHPDDRARVIRADEEQGAHGVHEGIEYRMLTRDERVIWVRDEAVLRVDEAGNPRFDGMLIDITERKEFELRLRFLADHDGLTGASNRRRFLAELEVELKRTRRGLGVGAVLIIDLDGLKATNDRYGHGVGDQMLRASATALCDRIRESDTVARLGGDEFAVLLRGADAEAAAEVARELLVAVRSALRATLPEPIPVGASVGVAAIRSDCQQAEDVLAAADRAMYEAKRAGGNRVVAAAADQAASG